MARKKRILVIVDPASKLQPALRRAEWLATKQGRAIELFVCAFDQYLAGEGLFDNRSLRKARVDYMNRHLKRLEKLARPLRAQGLDVTVDAAWDRPLHRAILRKVEKSKPAFVFKDTHYHSAVRRSIFSNTDWNLIRSCPSPLWLVKPRADSEIATILAAVDPLHQHDKPAKLDHRIVKTAGEVARACGAKLKLVHAFDPAPVYAASVNVFSMLPGTESTGEVVAALRSQHQAAMNKLAARHRISAGDSHILEGEAREALVGACERHHAGLIVMGAVARGALKRLVLGSTAERVLDFLPCDLLIVKPDIGKQAQSKK